MLSMRIFWLQLGLLAAVSSFDIYANMHFWYWRYPLIDVPVHFTAGIWVALFAVWLLRLAGRSMPGLLVLFTIVMAVGIGWEVYEYIFHLAYGIFYVYDTAKDLLMDALGGTTGYALVRYFKLYE